MKFLVIGLGSMGKRRIRSLNKLGYNDIRGFDTREDRCQEVVQKYELEVESDWVSAKLSDADAWIISTPPNLHMQYAFQAIEQKKHFFSEAGVSVEGMDDLIKELGNSNIVGVPSCTMRYLEGPKKIKELVQNGFIGRPLFFVYHWGQYLPTWHIYESYQDFYVSKRETGACREIVPFELEWLVDIFGIPITISCLKDKISDLNADIDDIYQLQMQFENNMMGSLIVDVFSQPAVNLIRISGTEGTIEFDQHENKFSIYNTKDGNLTQIDLDRGIAEEGYLYAEEPYVDEMKDFIGAILGDNRYPYTFSDDIKILNLLEKAEQSADQGSHIKTCPNFQ